jgi:hypothetical protein
VPVVGVQNQVHGHPLVVILELLDVHLEEQHPVGLEELVIPPIMINYINYTYN